MANRSKGRPRRYAEFDELVASLPAKMAKRPKYLKGIGVFRGARGDTAWLKIGLPQGGRYSGKAYPPGSALEIKMGKLSSWSWEQLVAKHEELQGLADRGEPLEDDPPVLFEAWASEWLSRAKRRVGSRMTEEINVQVHLIPAFGPKPLSEITVSDINRWIAQKLARQAPATVKREFNTLRAVLSSAVRSGHITTNPCRHADPIRGITERQRFLDGDELVRLLAAAEEVADWLPDFILWCVHSGMRKGEVRALLWSDIRVFADGPIIAQIRTSKSDQPRIVTCTQTMQEVLVRQRERQVEGDDRLCPISHMTLRRKWEQARERAGLQDVTLHDLRRTHTTHAAVAGVDLRTLAGRIGHADLTMLQKHYAAIVGSAEAEAAETIEQVFGRLGAAGSPTEQN